MKSTIQYHYLTIQEMIKKYPDYWILLLNPDFDNNYELNGGFFIAKSKNKNKLFDKIQKLCIKGSKKWRIFYSGQIKIPDNVIICL
ncbi:MAG: hypothetical protein HY738_06670 [Bacteroidia bacterium]|nr:hypothetical protein [Bacteroidia bacterium]